MVLEENWAVSEARIRAFFLEQPDVAALPQGFRFGSCSITLTPTTGSAGPFPVARTIVRMDGPEEAVRAIHQRFFLRFLSAGG